MFEDIRDELKDNWQFVSIMAFILVVAVIFLIVGFKSTEMQPINTHDMGNGAVCYTFNTSIDCLQIGE